MTKPNQPAGDRAPVPAKPARKRSKLPPAQREEAGEGPLHKHWRLYFLAALVETSNVTAAARKAGISSSRVYKLRAEDADFAAKWRTALHEGYQNLEMEVLGFLRGQITDRKIDVAGAVRLLTLHRDEVARERALADDRSEQDVLDSIDRMIDEMRSRSVANATILDADGESE